MFDALFDLAVDLFGDHVHTVASGGHDVLFGHTTELSGGSAVSSPDPSEVSTDAHGASVDGSGQTYRPHPITGKLVPSDG